jgi:hypothetical protein
MHDAVWLNAKLATMRAGGVPYGELRDGAIAATLIAATGSRARLNTGTATARVPSTTPTSVYA